MAKLQTFASVLLALASLTACESTEPEVIGVGGKADSPFGLVDLVPGSAPQIGLLRFVNDPNTTFEVLDDDASLRRNAARNLIEHRDGAGLLSDPFDSVDEIDDVPSVGDSALQSLLDFAFDNGFVPEGDDELGRYDTVSFTVREARAVVSLVNTSSAETLDDDIALDGRAVDAILEARPVQTVLALSELSFVGRSALEKLKERANDGAPIVRELGILSDLDKTIVPPAPSGQSLPDDPYPGMAELLSILEFGDGTGAAGDINFVTARQPESVVEIPDWLADNGVPLGPISTGISGIPFLAKDEKVRDITEVFEANPNQVFVMFGDSSHVDPDAYRIILDTFDAQVSVAFIHNVKTIDPVRLEGLILIENYAEAAAELLRLGHLSEDQARMVMLAVIAGGEIDQQSMEDLIAANLP